jgi:hypothetical protein
MTQRRERHFSRQLLTCRGDLARYVVAGRSLGTAANFIGIVDLSAREASEFQRAKQELEESEQRDRKENDVALELARQETRKRVEQLMLREREELVKRSRGETNNLEKNKGGGKSVMQQFKLLLQSASPMTTY